ncbi:late expression factor 11 [Adoxophyes honmai nucleopolyhedrovirus]|uniref:Late expression factor 11 n=1 Tax=Adoxophyes honmai nucleopolyhedrovirus TaxID=224399 RepID=LEF11_NPVAH|nr:late expression factor 11 [Adoxophyes honmai nucleopolyhedrovirus]Q80LT4.1 RecName: Full=Late expression factor 11 [Adoxophyes honmai nucleopolyhedrovirus]BAC67263.1 late expression factor 11 [Adoxophyes honmai nucleopolyhedrovirus]
MSKKENIIGNKNRTQKYNNACLTRSDVYALVKETINKRKHDGEFCNITAHIFDEGFEQQKEYIREKLSTASIVTDCRQNRKRLALHRKKIESIFNIHTSLQEEFNSCSRRYNGSPNLE